MVKMSFRAVVSAAGSAGLLALAASPALAATPLVGDGGFETPIASGDYQTVGPGDSSLAPWSVTSGNVDVVSKSLLTPNTGNQSLDLNGLVPGTLTQNIATVVGHTYRVDFALAGNPDPNGNPPPIKTLTVSLGTTSSPYSFDVTGRTAASMGWTNESLSGFTATSTSTALTFASTTNGVAGGPAYAGPELDDISVTDTTTPPAALPETPSVPLLALTGLGVIGGAVAVRRRA